MSSLDRSSSFDSISDLPAEAGFTTFLWHLFKRSEGNHKDVYFSLKYNGFESSFSAHKLVLALRSFYFADKFYGKDRIFNIIKLEGINPEDFEAMLNYMYDYRPSINTPKRACDIYKVAKEFQVISLQNFCNEKLSEIKVVPSNVFDMLEASDYLQNRSSRNKCLNLFQNNTREVFSATSDLSEISPSVISILLTSKKLSLESVSDLFIWIFAWAKNKSLKDYRFGTAREALQEFLPQLPFASLSVKQFADLYRCHQDIFYKDEVISIFMNFSLREGQEWRMPVWYNKELQVEINSESNG